MITREEYLKLKERYEEGYRWIARDEDGYLYLYHEKPEKKECEWTNYSPTPYRSCQELVLLQDVKWEDEKPTRISDLINDYELHETLKDKVKIPSFVADWIEHYKKEEFTLIYAFNDAYGDVKEWLFDGSCGKSINKFARAWLDGYEIEKEKLYTVTLANGSCLSKAGFMGISWLNRGSSNISGEYKLTQSEIESVDPILMKIAKEVE